MENGLLHIENNCTSSGISYEVNSTCSRPPPVFDQNALLRTILLTHMALLSLIGNVGIVRSIVLKYRRKNITGKLYRLLLQLAIADLLVTVWCIVGEAAWTFTVAWNGGNFLCKFMKFAQVFSLYLSTFILVLIGADHLQAIRNPIDRAIKVPRWCDTPIVVIWALSAVLAVPQLVIFKVQRGPFNEYFVQCVTYGFYDADWQEKVYASFSLLSMFVFPLVALGAIYSCICITISERQSDIFCSKTANRPHFCGQRIVRLQRAKVKSLQMSLLIVLAFVLCWTPYYVMMALLVFFDLPEDSFGLRTGIFFFGMSNSVINPLIYGAFHLWWPNKKGVANRPVDLCRSQP